MSYKPVSYTHLSYNFSNWFLIELCSLFLQRLLIIAHIFLWNSTLFVRSISVSYTHLDVYKRQVKHFGTHTLDIIEQEPERLSEVEGIASGRTGMIAKAWEEQKAIRDCLLYTSALSRRVFSLSSANRRSRSSALSSLMTPHASSIAGLV